MCSPPVEANTVNKTREETHVMVRLPEGMERGVLIDFILVAYLIAFILVMLGWLLSAIPEQMKSSLFWTIIASAFGALFALSVLLAQMLRSWKDKTAIMNKMDKNHSEITGELCKMNSTMLIIKNILEAGAAPSRPWFALPADPKPDVTSRSSIQ